MEDDLKKIMQQKTIKNKRVVAPFRVTLYQCSKENNISFQEQFIMSYAGLRGEMSFSLVLMICQDLFFPDERMFKSATLIIILFTVFVQGGTIKYWIRLFEIER